MQSRALNVFVMAAAALAGSPVLAEGKGLWDAGLLDGSWRSDYANPQLGGPGAALTYAAQCQFPGVRFAFCPANFSPIAGVDGVQPRGSFSRSNWTQRSNNAQGLFWVVGANTEPALDANCNSGPPNQSEPVGAPFEDLYGLAVRPSAISGAGYRQEVVLALDLSHRPRMLRERPGCITRDFVPYLGFGVQSERGGGGQPLATLNASDGLAPVLSFRTRLVESNAEAFAQDEPVPLRPRGQHAGLWVEARWAGVRRWIWIELFNTYEHGTTTYMAPWNWAIRESLHYPGAEIVVTSAAALHARCGESGLQIPPSDPARYAHQQPLPARIDLQRLFECVDDRFSTPLRSQGRDVAITGVHFFVEVGVRDHNVLPGLDDEDYESRLGMAFDSIDLLPGSAHALSSDDRLVDQLARDFLDRPWNTGERAFWVDHIQRQGRVATTAAMLRSQPVASSLVAAVRLHLIAFGEVDDRAGITEQAGRLRQQRLDAPRLAAELAGSARFQRRFAGLSNAQLAQQLFSSVLEQGGPSHTQDAVAATFGSAADWGARIDRGEAQRGDLLFSVFRLATAGGLQQPRVETASLYLALLKQAPNAHGLQTWQGAAQMPEALIEAIRYAPHYRQRLLPAGWR